MPIASLPGTVLALTIAAATSTRPALEALKPDLTRAAGEKVEIRYGATGTLARQIENGADFDLFFAADEETPKRIVSSLDMTTLVHYASGHVTLVAAKDTKFDVPARLDPSTVEIFRKLPFTAIALASPGMSPYGRAAQEVLGSSGLTDDVRQRVVLAETAEQVLAFVRRGNAEFGFVPASLLAEELRGNAPSTKAPAKPRTTSSGLRVVEIDERYSLPVRHFAAVVLTSGKREAARRALAAVLDKKAGAVWERFGFEKPGAR